ncbi:MAG: hypothetical protein R3C28_18995 [Pirellulaceae bacterium]
MPRPADYNKPPELLRTSAYDQVSSLLISLLILVGTAVAMLVVIFITGRVFRMPAPPMMLLVEEESGTQNPPGTAQDINEPGIEELEDLAEPDVKDTLAAVTDAVSTVAASLDAVEGVVATRGKGMGDNRKRGNGEDVIPRWERWEIRYTSTTLEAYAKQLEFFQIELGAISPARAAIEYATFRNGVPTKRPADPNVEEDRLYFSWQGRASKFKDQDMTLLRQAGINTAGAIICQFYSKELEIVLANVELNKHGDRPLKDIKKTIFGIQPGGSGFEFVVVDIRLR